jgi:hypothetical protein
MKSKFHQNWKAISFGLLIALLLTQTSYHLVTPRHNVFNEFDHGPINWNVSSSLQLAEKMNENSGNLLRVKVSVGKVLDTTGHIINIETGEISQVNNFFSWTSEPYFIYNTSGIDVIYISSKTELQHLIAPVDGKYYTEIFGPVPNNNKETTSNMLIDLHQEFTLDISLFTNLVNLTSVDIQNLTLNSTKGDLYWEIIHIYTDGTLLEFRVINTTMILRIIQLDHYNFYLDENGYPSGTTSGIPSDVVYPTYISEITNEDILPYYVEAINKFIGEFIDE